MRWGLQRWEGPDARQAAHNWQMSRLCQSPQCMQAAASQLRAPCWTTAWHGTTPNSGRLQGWRSFGLRGWRGFDTWVTAGCEQGHWRGFDHLLNSVWGGWRRLRVTACWHSRPSIANSSRRCAAFFYRPVGPPWPGCRWVCAAGALALVWTPRGAWHTDHQPMCRAAVPQGRQRRAASACLLMAGRSLGSQPTVPALPAILQACGLT